MKKTKFLAIFLAIVVILSVCLSACLISDYEITLNTDKSFTVKVGDTIDFTQYFIVKDVVGHQIVVTESMLDLSQVDLSKPGTFDVTLTIYGVSKTATFTVVANGGGSGGNGGSGDDTGDTPETINYTSVFLDKDLGVAAGSLEYTANVTANGFESDSYARGVQFLNAASVVLTSKTSVSGITMVEVTCSTNKNNGITVAVTVGGTQLTSSKNTVAKGTDNANTILQFTSGTALSGAIKVTITGSSDKSAYVKSIVASNGSASSGGGSSTNPSGTMGKQTYNPDTFDHDNLQDKMLDYEGAIGLPSTGSYNALVIPVQFVGDTITQTQLDRLDKAFNGNTTDTGWESVQSYYKKASYGNLNITFDIQSVYKAKQDANYYAKSSEPENILTEVLAYYEPLLDLTKYDNNKDGAIDAVYLIYSTAVDYDEADFYWAYVTWYTGSNKYDNLDAYYYLFAGFDFMDESTSRQDPSLDDYYEKISGLNINAATYIHETGHLLGLDDYYDYDESSGCNEGLGSADMMDYNVGDHNVYSKIMLGWMEPTIVNETATITIKSSQAYASAILIPLDFNNSYFCEYLLIDLYTAEGLNALHASVDYSYLYDGAAYGVRIYHVSSSINNPYSDKYGSFTDYNNTLTAKPLIKLIEADGGTKFSDSNGWAASSDLWKAGGQLSKKFPSYKRNDGKLLNFDIKINSVSANEASITVTFA